MRDVRWCDGPAVRWRSPAALLVALGLATGCREQVVPPPVDVQAIRVAAVPSSPEDALWAQVPVFAAPLLLQDVVEPRLLVPSVPEVRVQALTDGAQLAVRLAWDDPSQDDLPGAARFCDACAVQVPQAVEASVPNPQMGESGRPVEITHWRASWQAEVNGRGTSIQEYYPNAQVDHYPFTAAPLEASPELQREAEIRFSPARASGNTVSSPRTNAVEDLIATGPGSITAAGVTVSRGAGRRTPAGWEVVLTRPLPQGLAAGGESVIAFAVWQGADQEAGSRKMRSAWVPLRLE